MNNDETPAAPGAAAEPGRRTAHPATVPPWASDLGADDLGPFDYPAPDAQPLSPATTWRPTPTQRPVVLTFRIGCALIGGTGGAALWLALYLIVSSVFGLTDDPHGYGIVFGVLFYVPASIACAVFVPLAFPKRRWRRAGATSLLLWGALTALLVVMLNLV